MKLGCYALLLTNCYSSSLCSVYFWLILSHTPRIYVFHFVLILVLLLKIYTKFISCPPLLVFVAHNMCKRTFSWFEVLIAFMLKVLETLLYFILHLIFRYLTSELRTWLLSISFALNVYLKPVFLLFTTNEIFEKEDDSLHEASKLTCLC